MELTIKIGKMEKIQKIKLMMGYDMSKTLNENKVSLSIIEENKDYNLDEGIYDAEARAFETALKSAGEELPSLKTAIEDAAKTAKPFKDINGKTITTIEGLESSMAKGEVKAVDLGVLRKKIVNDPSVKNEIKAAFRETLIDSPGFITKYNTSAWTDELMVAELEKTGYDATQAKAITDEFFIKKNNGTLGKPTIKTTNTTAVADATKNDANQIQTSNINGNNNVSQQGNYNVNQQGNNNVSQQFVAGRDINLYGQQIEKRGGRAAKTKADVKANVGDAKADPKIPNGSKTTLETNVKETEKIHFWDKFKNRASKILNNKWLWGLGILGGGYAIYKFLFGGNTNPEIPKWSPCLTDIYNSGGDNVELLGTKKGDPVLHVKVSERYPELDAVGGLWFFHNGRVMSADQGKTKRGTWSCEGGQLATNTTEPISQIAEQALLNEDALGDISITWDGEAEKAPSPNPEPVVTTGSTSSYKECTEFPFAFGCKNEKIKEIQKCLGLEDRYQTGNFGPITSAKLKDNEYQSDSISQETYNKIIAACNGTEPEEEPQKVDIGTPPIVPTGTTTSTTGETTSTETKPTEEPKVDMVAEGKKLYDGLRQNKKDGTYPRLVVKGDGRIRYKGENPSDSDFNNLNAYIESLGYKLLPQRDSQQDKEYGGTQGVKHTWEKQEA